VRRSFARGATVYTTPGGGATVHSTRDSLQQTGGQNDHHVFLTSTLFQLPGTAKVS